MIRTLIALVAFTWMTVTGAAAADRPIPRIEGRQLIVDGAPWLLLGGELANSSASSRAYMAPRWERLAGLNLNRSEEHTSELQSLMRISYAVFCLQKKKYLRTVYKDTRQKN